MFAAIVAFAAAVAFLLGIVVPDVTHNQPEFWLLLGLAFAAAAAGLHLLRVHTGRVP